MAKTKSIQFAFDGNNNAPQLTTTQGSLVTMLDAVLVNGYGTQNVATLEANNEGVITASFNSAHNFKSGQVILIEGASDTLFNGLFRIDTIKSNSLKFIEKLNGEKSTTGTITAKIAPLGYEIAFTDGAYKRAYKSLNPENIMHYIFDDNLWAGWNAGYAKICNVGLALEMTDINTITGLQCPYNPQNPDQNWKVSGSGGSAIPGWAKIIYGCWSQGVGVYLSQLSHGNHTWSVIGNDEGFYLCAASSASGSNLNKNAVCNYFGKYESLTRNSLNYLFCTNLKRQAGTDYQDVNSAFLAPGKSLAEYRADCKLFAGNDGVNLTTAVTPVFSYSGQSATNNNGSDSHIFDDTTGVSLIKIPFLNQSTGLVEGNLPFVYATLQSRRSAANEMGGYTQQTSKHDNGNYFVEINSFPSSNGNVSSFFFELQG